MSAEWTVRKRLWSNEVTEHTRPAEMAGAGYIGENAIKIRVGRNINGSGPNAFGGAKEWPSVDLDVAFPATDKERAEQFAEALKAFVDSQIPYPVEKEIA